MPLTPANYNLRREFRAVRTASRREKGLRSACASRLHSAATSRQRGFSLYRPCSSIEPSYKRFSLLFRASQAAVFHPASWHRETRVEAVGPNRRGDSGPRGGEKARNRGRSNLLATTYSSLPPLISRSFFPSELSSFLSPLLPCFRGN